MNTQQLVDFVTEKVRAGSASDDIRKQLLAVGWADDEIDAALAAGLAAAGVPVPERAKRAGLLAKKASAVEVALNFFSFVLLGISATAVGVLYYQVINRFFPDPLIVDYWSRGSVNTSAIHYAISALLVAFPLYYYAMHLWFRRFRDDDRKVASSFTKFLTYIVLLIASVTIVGDLITTVFYFLEGEISIRFFLKALVILVIASAVFGFYFLERRVIQFRRDVALRTFQWFGIGVTVFVACGIVLGFFAGGLPWEARLRGLDDRREENLRTLSGCIGRYARAFEKLPQSLSDLETGASANQGYYNGCTLSMMRDPETGASYEYRVIVPMRTQGTVREGEFELCATFATFNDELVQDNWSAIDDKWARHSAGRECDRETVPLERATDIMKAPTTITID